MLITVIGWIGSFLLAICSIPQCYQTYKTKSAKDISLSYLLMWLFGIWFTAAFVLLSPSGGSNMLPLYANYVTNTFMCGYLVWAKFTYK